MPQSAGVERPSWPGPTQSAALETLAVLEKMGQLRDAGVVTQEESETKKAELLSRFVKA